MDLFDYERDLWKKGFVRIAGCDESGRGPLAGPVVAAAAVFSRHHQPIEGITDCKKLSVENRFALYDRIVANTVDYGIGIVDHSEIDAINILQASLKAMRLAVEALQSPPDYVLIDGRFVPDLPVHKQAIIKGDALSYSIAAASILAKVTRDRLMADFHHAYPQYGFNKHMGYATPEHIEALRKNGPCPIHRVSFQVKALLGIQDFDIQG